MAVQSRLPNRRGAWRALLLAGVASLALSACATNPTRVRAPDFSGQSPMEAQATLGELASRYKQQPKDKATAIYFAAALRANNQPEQAVAVLEAGLAAHGGDPDLRIAYAKAL